MVAGARRATRFATVLFSIACLWMSASARAQTINVTGILDAGATSPLRDMVLTGGDGFALFPYGITTFDNLVGIDRCNHDPIQCAPGATLSLFAGNSDRSARVTFNGITYSANSIDSTASLGFQFTGAVTLPPIAPTATVTGRFSFSGGFTIPGFSYPLAGAGTATIWLHSPGTPGFPNSWFVDRVQYQFDSTLPAPWLAVDVGPTGLSGSTASNADGTWNVAGSGGDIWGATDAFQFAFPFPGGNEIVARVDSEENTSVFAKAGVMMRATFDAGSPHVLLDVVPGGGVEFMTRTSQGGATTFVAGTQVTFPVWLKLSQGQGITASVSEDGNTWQVVGVAATPFSSPLTGLVVTSHDTSVVNHAVFSNVSETTQSVQLPGPWVQTDIGAVGQAGEASYDANTNVFTVSGSGADIWGTTDAFDYVYSPLAGNGSILASVVSEENTNAFAKAGLVMRSTTDPSSASVIIDAKPDGSVEFMARTTAGGATTFVAGLPPDSFPRELELTRNGATVTGWVLSDGTFVQVGSVTVEDFSSGGVLAGMAVTSHDTSVINTAGFQGAFVIAAPPLPPNWSTQDIGATGLAGSASADSLGFTVQGAGADIWGTNDAFRFAFESSANTSSSITARMVSEDASNPFAKAGLMLRNGVADDAAFVILDVKPDGGLEFMSRSADGESVQVVGGASVGFGTLLKLTRSGSTVAASYSQDGSSWTTLGTTDVAFTGPTAIGLAVCSHDPTVLNTAKFDNVAVID